MEDLENDIKIFVSDEEEEGVELNEEVGGSSNDDDDDDDEEQQVDDDPLLLKPVELVDHDEEDQQQQQPISALTLDVDVDTDDDDDIDDQEEVNVATTDTEDDEEEEAMVVCTAIEQHKTIKKKKKISKWKRRRTRLRSLFRRGRGRGAHVRMGAVSWWTECKNIETSGCTFVLGYILISFILMSLMFNMREIVGDYCLGSKELKREEYLENLEKAMELRRRPHNTVDDLEDENRFEKELAAGDLYYDKQGQTADDIEYFQNHRVPIIHHSGDEDEFDEFGDP